MARRAGISFPDGIWWIELAPIARPELVPAAISTLLGLRETSGRTPLETIVDRLSGAQALLVLDNCEHLLATCAEFVEGLLSGCPDVRLLATSQRLAVSAEVVWQVPPLRNAKPPISLRREPPTCRGTFASVSTTRTRFETSAEGLRAFRLRLSWRRRGSGCWHRRRSLSGWATSWVLGAGGPDAVPRLRTLEASIEWSHELLSEQERVVFRRLAVFAGGWGLEAAEQVCAGPDVSEREVLDLLGGLVDKSLVRAEPSDGVPIQLLGERPSVRSRPARRGGRAG